MRSLLKEETLRRTALVAIVLALVVGGLGLSASPAAHAEHEPLGHPCDIDIYIVDFQFMYQTCFEVAGQKRYTLVMRPAHYISVPFSRPLISPEGHPPRTYWFRNITNLMPIPITFAQCHANWETPSCLHISAAALFDTVTLSPGERFTYPPASNEDYGFPDCIKDIRFMSREFPWMQGWVTNEGWFTNPDPC